MKRMSDKQVIKLMREIDVDGDGTISIEEFDVWWRANGGSRYRPAPPPAPGDMSKQKQFEEKRQRDEKHQEMRDTVLQRGEIPMSPSSEGSPRSFDVEDSRVYTNPLAGPDSPDSADAHRGHGWVRRRILLRGASFGSDGARCIQGTMRAASHLTQRAARMLSAPLPVRIDPARGFGCD